MLSKGKHHLPKFSPPYISGLYIRERLFKLLDGLSDKRVLWLSAPAGSGKTSLVASYLNNNNIRTIWYQIDVGDNDIASFFYHMALCIKCFYPKKRGSLPEYTHEYLGSLPAFSINYFRELFNKVEPGAAIVLDNLQDAGDNALLYDILQYAISEIPNNNQIIIMSRQDPPGSLARFRTSGLFELLSMKDINFLREESDEIATQRTNIPLTKEQLKSLYELTDGWAAGLILSIEHMKTNPDFLNKNVFSSQNTLFDYIANEIFYNFDKSTQVILLKTSLLKRITIDIANKLTGDPDTRPVLQELSSHQLLTVRHDHANSSFEYHPLFRDFLLHHSQKYFSYTEINDLKNRAGELLLNEGETQESAQLFIQTNNWEGLIKLVKLYAEKTIQKGLYLTVDSWVNAIPDSIIENDIWLQYWKYVCILQYDPSNARETIIELHNLFIRENDRKGAYLSFCNIIESYLQSYDSFSSLKGWIEHFDKLKTLFPGIPGIELKARTTVSLFAAMMYTWPDHPEFKSRLKKLKFLYNVSPNKQIRGLLGGLLGTYYVIVMDILRMTRLNKQLADYLNSDDVTYMVKLFVLYSIGLQHTFLGNLDDMESTWNLGLEISEKAGLKFFNNMFKVNVSTALVSKGDLNTAQKVLNEIIIHPDDDDNMTNVYYLATQARIDFSRNDLEYAYKIAKRSSDLAEKHKLLYGQSITLILLGLILAAKGQNEAGIEKIETARKIMSRYDERYFTGVIYNSSLAYLYLQNDELEIADKYLQIAFSIAKDEGVYAKTDWCSQFTQTLAARAIDKNIEPEYTLELIKRNKITPPEDYNSSDFWPYPIKIYTLNRFGILKEDETLRPSNMVQNFIKALIALGGRDIHEETLSNVLWPDSEGDTAHQNLSTTLYRARKLIGNDVIQLRQNRVTLNSRLCWIDIWSLNRVLTEIEKRISTDKKVSSELIDRAITLYQGPFLGSDENEHWMLSTREKLRNLFLRVITNAADIFCKTKECSEALNCYKKGLEIDDLSEHLYQGIMHCYICTGEKAEGLASYQRCRERLETSFGVPPSRETEKLYQTLKSS